MLPASRSSRPPQRVVEVAEVVAGETQGHGVDGEVAPARGPRRAGRPRPRAARPAPGRPRAGWRRGRAAGRRRESWRCRSARARASRRPGARRARAPPSGRRPPPPGRGPRPPRRAAGRVPPRPPDTRAAAPPAPAAGAPRPARGAGAHAGLPVRPRHRRTGIPAARMRSLASRTRVAAVVEDRGAQHGIGAATVHRLHQVVQRARTARRDHRHVDGIGDGARELQLVAVLGAVAVHAGEQDLPRARAPRPRGPRRARRVPPACGRRSRTRRSRRRRPCAAHRSASTTHWAPNTSASSPSSSGRATAAELTETLSAPASSTAWASSTERTPPPMVKGMKTSSAQRRASCGHGLALLVRGRYVEEDDLVGSLLLVAHGQLDRVPGVAQVHELHALDHAPLVHVEAGDHASQQHQSPSSSAAWPSAHPEAPLVERLAGDHPRQVEQAQPAQRPQVLDRADPARVQEAATDGVGPRAPPHRGRAPRACRHGRRWCRRSAWRRAAACAGWRPRRAPGSRASSPPRTPARHGRRPPRGCAR